MQFCIILHEEDVEEDNSHASRNHHISRCYQIGGSCSMRSISKLFEITFVRFHRSIQLEICAFLIKRYHICSGNRFKVALRGVDPSMTEDKLGQILKSVKKEGFLNYFGLQRFGSQVRNLTHIFKRFF